MKVIRHAHYFGHFAEAAAAVDYGENSLLSALFEDGMIHGVVDGNTEK